MASSSSISSSASTSSVAINGVQPAEAGDTGGVEPAGAPNENRGRALKRLPRQLA